jgi:L-alanine-DL-glutamate epimerase-like enolase superfamily enzyme
VPISRRSDIEVLDARATFVQVDLDHPFVISGRTIDWFTLAVVEVDVRNRLGVVASGRGASILSVPWAWPRSVMSVESRDLILRDLTYRFAEHVCGLPPTDPVQHWLDARAGLMETAAKASAAAPESESIPPLAALLPLGAVDNALHDGWARAADRPAHTMYTGRYLGRDLGAVFGPPFSGRWPGEYLTSPRSRVEIQHVVGVTDPLKPADAGADERSVQEWLSAERARHLKVKVGAHDPHEDAWRVAAVHRIGRDLGIDASLAIDPNEGYAKPEELAALLDELDRIDPAAGRAVAYVEQPVPRDSTPDPMALAEIGHRVPIIMDEGLVDLHTLGELRAAGWSGVVIKAGKGQSAALLAHAVAKASGLYVTVQDLTAVDSAFHHSARLASVLDLSSPHLEYNSRQYAPAANSRLATEWPDLAAVRDGAVTVPSPVGPGIY